MTAETETFRKRQEVFYQIGGDFKARLGYFINDCYEYQVRGRMIAGDPDGNILYLYEDPVEVTV